MSTLETIAAVLAAAWLGVISVVLVLLVRQMDLLRAWATEQIATPTDGLEVGADVPGELAPLLDGAPERGPAYLLFLGGNCQPCREFAIEARDSAEMSALGDRYGILAALTGTDSQAEDLAELLPPWVETVQGRGAKELMRGFEVVQTPSIFEIDGSKVTGRAVAGYGLTNFLNLVDAREASDAAKFAGSAGKDSIDLHVTHNVRQTGSR